MRAALLACLMAGCSSPAPPSVLPEGPPGLVAAGPDSFAGPALVVHERAIALAEARLADFAPLARQPLRAWPADRDRGELVVAWDRLLAAQGFARMETGLASLPDFLGPGSWLVAWTRQGQVIALVGATAAEPGAARVPVTILTGSI